MNVKRTESIVSINSTCSDFGFLIRVSNVGIRLFHSMKLAVITLYFEIELKKKKTDDLFIFFELVN